MVDLGVGLHPRRIIYEEIPDAVRDHLVRIISVLVAHGRGGIGSAVSLPGSLGLDIGPLFLFQSLGTVALSREVVLTENVGRIGVLYIPEIVDPALVGAWPENTIGTV